jgi:hypothetical protein
MRRTDKVRLQSLLRVQQIPRRQQILPLSRTSVHAAETRSSISVDIEAPMTLGKLTIANPDAPSAATTPAKTEEPLPANDVDTLSQHTLRPATGIPSISRIYLSNLRESQRPHPHSERVRSVTR